MAKLINKFKQWKIRNMTGREYAFHVFKKLSDNELSKLLDHIDKKHFWD